MGLGNGLVHFSSKLADFNEEQQVFQRELADQEAGKLVDSGAVPQNVDQLDLIREALRSRLFGLCRLTHFEIPTGG